jgi:hypothetical protein
VSRSGEVRNPWEKRPFTQAWPRLTGPSLAGSTAVTFREVLTAGRGETRRRGAHPDMAVPVRGREVGVVTGRSQRGGGRKSETGGHRRCPDLGAVPLRGPGLGERLHQLFSGPPPPVRQRPERVEGVS